MRQPKEDDKMSKYRVVITISREFDNRANALSACDAITSKVPDAWEIRTEDVQRV
jgi:hypothetical protein